MIDKVKGAIDKSRHFSAFLTALSKASDCQPHDLIITKLDAYDFKYDTSCLILNYLNNGKERVKTNPSIFVLLKLPVMLMSAHQM